MVATFWCVMSESAEQTARHNKKSSSFDQIALYSGIKEGEVPLEIPVRPCENLLFGFCCGQMRLQRRKLDYELRKTAMTLLARGYTSK